MKKTILSAILLSSLIAAPASARISDDEILDINAAYTWYGNSDSNNDSVSHKDTGYEVSMYRLQQQSKNKHHWLGFGSGIYKDQYNEIGFHFDAIYKYRIYFNSVVDSIELNAKLSAQNRVYRTINNSERGFEDKRDNRFALIPSVTANITDHVNMEVTYLPSGWSADYTDGFEFVSVSLGYRF